MQKYNIKFKNLVFQIYCQLLFFLPPPLKGRNTSESLSLLNHKRFMRSSNIAHQLYFHLPYLLIKQNLTNFKLTKTKNYF